MEFPTFPAKILPMKKVKVAGAALNQTPLDWIGNGKRILEAISLARKQKINILCLPELCITGYGCEDAFFYDYVAETAWEILEAIKEHVTGNLVVSVGLPVIYENATYDCVAVLYQKKIIGIVAKQDLAGDGIYYEPRWFKKWEKGKSVFYKTSSGKEVPFGDLLFEIDGIRIGFEICEDAWNGIRPAQDHYLHNADIILNPSASNFSFGKSKLRHGIVVEGSRAFKCTYVYTNLLGNESGRIIFDGEIMIAQDGKLLAFNRLFQYEDIVIRSAVVDIEKTRISKRKLFNFSPEIEKEIIEVSGNSSLVSSEDLSEEVSYEFPSKEEEFFLAETLALFDYMRKSYSRGFVISLSGGADSSACAVLCSFALRRAYQELPEETFLQKLSYWKEFSSENLDKLAVFSVYQATENSSEKTLQSARELATELGHDFVVWNIQEFVNKYEKLVENTLGRKLTWEKDDLALQNLQARARVPALWMMANIRGALLITTSNRSEAAVGYATMDGDTAGGLAPLAGIDKHFLIQWLQWAKDNLQIKNLKYVLALRPTAELRPKEMEQTDEKDLMPYATLDKIERLSIHEHKGVFSCYEVLNEDLPAETSFAYLKKFFTLWARNQWKRERYAPAFHVDDANLDPKTWCRFPILNGGFSWELQKLRERISGKNPGETK